MSQVPRNFCKHSNSLSNDTATDAETENAARDVETVRTANAPSARCAPATTDATDGCAAAADSMPT